MESERILTRLFRILFYAIFGTGGALITATLLALMITFLYFAMRTPEQIYPLIDRSIQPYATDPVLLTGMAVLLTLLLTLGIMLYFLALAGSRWARTAISLYKFLLATLIGGVIISLYFISLNLTQMVATGEAIPLQFGVVTEWVRQSFNTFNEYTGGISAIVVSLLIGAFGFFQMMMNTADEDPVYTHSDWKRNDPAREYLDDFGNEENADPSLYDEYVYPDQFATAWLTYLNKKTDQPDLTLYMEFDPIRSSYSVGSSQGHITEHKCVPTDMYPQIQGVENRHITIELDNGRFICRVDAAYEGVTCINDEKVIDGMATIDRGHVIQMGNAQFEFSYKFEQGI